MSKAAISIQGLTKTFSVWALLRILMKVPPGPGATEVLKGISLEISASEAVGSLGPNGAGKTTLVEILSTLLLPTSGTASVCGYDVVHEAARLRRVVGYCRSTPETFYPRLTGAGNLEFFAIARRETATSLFVRHGGQIRASKRVKVALPCLWYSPCGLRIAAEERTERWTDRRHQGRHTRTAPL